MHYLVVLCDYYKPEEVMRFRVAVAARQLVTQGNVSAIIAVAAGFEELPWEGAVDIALADYETCDRADHLLYIRAWAVLDDISFDRLVRSAGPMYKAKHAFAEWVVYGPSYASNVLMVLREAQIGLFEHLSFDQSVIDATSAAGLYQVIRRQAFGRDGATLVRHADGTALAFATETEVQAALASLAATAPLPSAGNTEPDYGYHALIPRGPGLPPVNPMGLTPTLAAMVKSILPAEDVSEAVQVHGIILANGTALVRMDAHGVSWFVVSAELPDAKTSMSGEQGTALSEDNDETATEEILDYLDREQPGGWKGTQHVSVHRTAAEAEPFALMSNAKANYS